MPDYKDGPIAILWYVRLSLKTHQVTNTLAYFGEESVTGKKGFFKLAVDLDTRLN
jgi:hypothetical protein